MPMLPGDHLRALAQESLRRSHVDRVRADLVAGAIIERDDREPGVGQLRRRGVPVRMRSASACGSRTMPGAGRRDGS